MFESPAPTTAPMATAALQVAEGLTERILAAFAPGSQLPAEADLAADFGVSRITIREAMKILAGRGLVSLARGKRATVRQPDGAMFGAFLRSLIRSDAKALFDLLQVRRALEIQSVSFAVRQASRTGLVAIEAALQGMADAAADPGPGAERDFHRADVRFHAALALSGGNRVLTYLFEAMESSLLEAFIVSHRGHRLAGRSLAAIHEEHQVIYRHIAARDEKAAIEAMQVLLDRAEANLRAAYASPV